MGENAADKAENSQPNLHLFNLSLVNTFDSEIPGTSSSFSIPSGPPDIGNWFSSYVYESPALDTEEELNSAVSGGADSEKVDGEDNLTELRNDVQKDVLAFGEKISSFDHNKQHNPSVNKNKGSWFITKKGGNENLDGKLVNDHNLLPFKDDTTACLRNVDSPQELEDKSSVLSDLSEPPDIRNWFSSYVYESPALDPGEELNSSVSGESSESEKPGFISEDFDWKKEDDLVELKNHEDKNASVSGGRDNEQQNQSVNKGQSNLFATKIGENESLCGKEVKDYDLVPFKYDATPILPSTDPPQKLEANFSSHADSILSKRKKASSTNCEKHQLNLIERKDWKENHVEGIDSSKEVDHHEVFRKGSRVSPKKLLPCSNSGEEGRNVTMNGFVSTKKNNCTNKNGGNYIKSSRENQIVSEIQTKVVRKPMSERTNNYLNEVVTQEITGKWKFPQKSKPDLGPPMKQQRLERWIHRV